MNNQTKSNRGGHREGAGRKAIGYVKRYGFNATREASEILEGLVDSRTDYINAAICFYHSHLKK